jgi:hypothetical protein
MNLNFRADLHQKKISGRNLAENLYRSGSRFGRIQKSGPEPVKNRPDPQHCRELLESGFSFPEDTGTRSEVKNLNFIYSTANLCI